MSGAAPAQRGAPRDAEECTGGAPSRAGPGLDEGCRCWDDDVDGAAVDFSAARLKVRRKSVDQRRPTNQRGRGSLKTPRLWPALPSIVLQNSWEDIFGATIESETRMQRIEVALRHSATNQCCAIESAKYFCNTICQERTWMLLPRFELQAGLAQRVTFEGGVNALWRSCRRRWQRPRPHR